MNTGIFESGNTQVQARVFEDLNHLFAKTITGSLADYSDPKAKVSSRFIEELTVFVSRSLAKK